MRQNSTLFLASFSSKFRFLSQCTLYIVHICKGKAIVIKENGYTVEVSESSKKRQLFACQLYFGVCTVDVMKFDHQKRHHLSTIIYVGQGQLRNPFFLLLDQPLLFTTAHNKLVGRNKKRPNPSIACCINCPKKSFGEN